jgi:hypothetical protein
MRHLRQVRQWQRYMADNSPLASHPLPLSPPLGGPGLDARLYGDLAPILAFCEAAEGK